MRCSNRFVLEKQQLAIFRILHFFTLFFRRPLSWWYHMFPSPFSFKYRRKSRVHSPCERFMLGILCMMSLNGYHGWRFMRYYWIRWNFLMPFKKKSVIWCNHTHYILHSLVSHILKNDVSERIKYTIVQWYEVVFVWVNFHHYSYEYQS